MGKIATNIELTEHSVKWGIVEVTNPDGSINRQYKITSQETLAVMNGNNVLPPGCTPEEWFSGRVVVGSKVCNPGQAVTIKGELFINQGIDESNPKELKVNIVKVPAQLWDKTDKVNIDDSVPIKPQYKAVAADAGGIV